MTQNHVPMGVVPLRVQSEEQNHPESLVDLLLECHARIRSFVRLAGTVGAKPELPSDEIKEATAQCLRYFTQALPLHVRDEEESVWPRLAGTSDALDSTLAQMHVQHQDHETDVATLLSALEAVHASPQQVDVHRQLEEAASVLENDFEAHLRLEEVELFPILKTALDADIQTLMVSELRARRTSPESSVT